MFFKQIHKLLVEWLDDIDQKIQSDDSLLNDLSEKKAKLEKFKTFNRDIDSHKDLVNKLNEKLQEDSSLKSKDIDDTLKRYEDIKKTVNDMISVSVFYEKILLYRTTYYIYAMYSLNVFFFYRNLKITSIPTFSIRSLMTVSMTGSVIARLKYSSVQTLTVIRKKFRRSLRMLTRSLDH